MSQVTVRSEWNVATEKSWLPIYVLANIFLLMTIPNSIFEAMDLINGSLNKLVPTTPIYFKVYKDIFLIAAYAYTLVHLKKSMLHDLWVINIWLGTALIFFIVSLYNETWIVSVLGLRSYASLIYVYLGYLLWRFDFRRIYFSFSVLMIVELVFQVYEMFYAPNFYGNQIFGLNARNPGTFTSPGILGLLAVLFLYFSLKYKRRAMALLAIISVLLSNSSAAAIALLLSLAGWLLLRFGVPRRGVVVLLVLLSLISIPLLPVLTIRDDVYSSALPRLEILLEYLTHPVGVGFGLGTSAALLWGVEGAIIPDSIINSNLINLGYVGILLTLVLFAWVYTKFRCDALLFYVFMFSALTLVLLEITPLSQIIFFMLGASARMQREKRLNSTASPKQDESFGFG